MNDIIENIRNKSRELLESNQVEAVLGFRRGTLPTARPPYVARTSEQAGLLYWDSFCLLNLAKFIPSNIQGKVAIITKGCDWRNLIIHNQENRLDLDAHVVVLGVECGGMLDPEKIGLAAGGLEHVLNVVCEEDQLRVQTFDGELKLKKQSLYRQACLECIQTSPLSADDWLESQVDKLPAMTTSKITDLFESDDPTSRRNKMREVFQHCVMCFACRDACPLCYCNHCFVDVEKSHWLAIRDTIDSALDFHFFRAHHLAGRCTGCGACDSACPMNIPVRQLAKKLTADIEETTGYIPGLKVNAEPPEGVFKPSYHEVPERR